MKSNAAAHGMVLKPREGVSSEPVQNTVMRHVNGIWLNLLCFVVFFNFFFLPPQFVPYLSLSCRSSVICGHFCSRFGLASTA